MNQPSCSWRTRGCTVGGVRIVWAEMNDRIVIDPRICHGKPVIRGTRMPVALVIGSLAGAMSFEEVEREYGLTQDDIRAALKFAGELVDQEEHHILASASR